MPLDSTTTREQSPPSQAVPPSMAPRRPWLAVALCALGVLALGGSALDLSAHGLAHYLNSDFFTPYVFCRELLWGRYPMSGWTLSASPYLVPDQALLGSLFLGFGPSGLAYALYTLVFYPLLFVLAGFCVRTAVGRAGPAFLASLLFGNGLLAMRFLPDHDRFLWWLGAPCCHGGVLVLGFAYLWLLGAGLRRGRVGFLPVPLFCLSLLGLWSDTLFLLQIVLPAGAALFLCRRRDPAFVPSLRWQGGTAAAALAASLLCKVLCAVNGWFYFSRIFRHAPTPRNLWRTLGQFVSDLPALLHGGWGFLLLAAAAAWSLRPRRSSSPGHARVEESQGGVLAFYRVTCVASLLLILPLPILICAWTDESNVRYFFNWLVLPAFLLMLAAAERWHAGTAAPAGRLRRPWLLPVGALAVFAACLGCAADGLRQEPLRFPYPDDVAALDAYLQSRGLKHGLADYWNAKYLTNLSHAGVELRQIRPNGDLYFWDNNAFGYYEAAANGTLLWPAYQFILTDTLDEQALSAVFGEPQAREQAGPFHLWLYSPDGQRRIRDVLEPGVRRKLGPRRLPRLRLAAPAVRPPDPGVDAAK